MRFGLIYRSGAKRQFPLSFAWDLPGTFNVRDRVDADTLTLPGNREFSRLQFCAFRHPVHIIDIDVYFADGGHQDIDACFQINPVTVPAALT